MDDLEKKIKMDLNLIDLDIMQKSLKFFLEKAHLGQFIGLADSVRDLQERTDEIYAELAFGKDYVVSYKRLRGW